MNATSEGEASNAANAASPPGPSGAPAFAGDAAAPAGLAGPPVLTPSASSSPAALPSPSSPPAPALLPVVEGERRQAVVSVEQTQSVSPPTSVLPVPLNGPAAVASRAAPRRGELPNAQPAPEAAAGLASAFDGGATDAGALSPRMQVTFWSILVSPLAAFPAFLAARLLWLMKVLAVLSAVFMLLSPLPTVIRIKACHSTAELQGLPYVMLLLSAVIWLVYGTLRRDLVLFAPNLCGLFLSAWYVHVFRKFCKNPHQAELLRIYIALSGFLLAGIFIACLFLGFDSGTQLVGLAAAVINVFSYVAPLSALRVILREKSTACLPVEVSIGNWICSSLWLFYGWLSEDLFILLPNLIGTVVGSAQLVLLVLYPPPSRRGFSVLGGSNCSRPYRPPACAIPAVEEDFPVLLPPSYGSPGAPAPSSLAPLSASQTDYLSPSASFASAPVASVASTAASHDEERESHVLSREKSVRAADAAHSSVCGVNAPSLPTHEMLLRDWKQRLLRAREEERLGRRPEDDATREGPDWFLDCDEHGNPLVARGSVAGGAYDAAGRREAPGDCAFLGEKDATYDAQTWTERTSASFEGRQAVVAFDDFEDAENAAAAAYGELASRSAGQLRLA